MINAMRKPRITKVKGSPHWNCDGALGRNPWLAYWKWHMIITGVKRK